MDSEISMFVIGGFTRYLCFLVFWAPWQTSPAGSDSPTGSKPRPQGNEHDRHNAQIIGLFLLTQEDLKFSFAT